MAEIVADCPRCGALKVTFDVTYSHPVSVSYGWKHRLEIHSICRGCSKGTIFIADQKGAGDAERNVILDGLQKLKGNVNKYLDQIDRYVSLRDRDAEAPPEYLPANIDAAFREGAACHSIGCYNAAATMFRLCVDLATRPLLPVENVDGLNGKIRFSLGLRLSWLFSTKRLPDALQDLSEAVKDDGNEGAHEGTLTKADAEDLLDFATALLERLYTEPRKLELARERRESRKSGKV